MVLVKLKRLANTGGDAMSREREVKELVDRLKRLYDEFLHLRFTSSQLECIDRLADMALESIPSRYTPREEVKTGYYFARYGDAGRMPIEVRMMGSGCLVVFFCGNECDEPLEDFDDFLPVPAWLVEGVSSEGRGRE